MARTVTEIYNTFLSEKEKYSSLSGLTSTSTTAIWRSIYYAAAVVMGTAEQLRDVWESDMLESAATLPCGTPKWYAARLLEYQEGYVLEYNRTNGRLEYSTIDEEARIIKVATCESESDTVVLKCAKSDGGTGLTNLSVSEYIAVREYIDQYKFAGTIVSLISNPADLLQLSIKVKVDTTLITTDGYLVSNNTTYPIEDAINTFIKEYSLTNFNSTLQLSDLVDAIQKVNGVKTAVISVANAKPSGGVEYIDVLSTTLHTYKAEAGYCTIDPSYTLRDHITYVS